EFLLLQAGQTGMTCVYYLEFKLGGAEFKVCFREVSIGRVVFGVQHADSLFHVTLLPFPNWTLSTESQQMLIWYHFDKRAEITEFRTYTLVKARGQLAVLIAEVVGITIGTLVHTSTLYLMILGNRRCSSTRTGGCESAAYTGSCTGAKGIPGVAGSAATCLE